MTWSRKNHKIGHLRFFGSIVKLLIKKQLSKLEEKSKE